MAEECVNAMETSPLTVTASSATDDDVPTPTKKFKGSHMLRAYLVDSSDEDDDSTPAATAAEMLSTEIACYDSSKIVHHTMQPIDFWKSAKSQYPLLSTIAYRLLAIPATSVPSERLFSMAGLVVSKLRASTSPENVAKISFLNKNVSD